MVAAVVEICGVDLDLYDMGCQRVGRTTGLQVFAVELLYVWLGLGWVCVLLRVFRQCLLCHFRRGCCFWRFVFGSAFSASTF